MRQDYNHKKYDNSVFLTQNAREQSSVDLKNYGQYRWHFGLHYRLKIKSLNISEESLISREYND